MRCIQAALSGPAGPVEVGEFTDVVDFEVLRALTHLAAPGDEPVDQLVTPGAGQNRPLVGEDGCVCPLTLIVRHERGGYFSILQRKIITGGDFTDLADLTAKMLRFQQHYNTAAEPFHWRFTKTELRRLIERIAAHADPPQLAA